MSSKRSILALVKMTIMTVMGLLEQLSKAIEEELNEKN